MYQRDLYAHGVSLTESRRHRITLSSGLTLNVVEWQQPQRSAVMPTILLLHGLGDSTCVWRDVATGLRADAHVLAIDLRGHGDSEWVASAGYQVQSMAADIDELLHTFEPSRLTLVGHSMGAAVALRVAATHPRQVERLVLADFGLDAPAENVAQLRQALREAHRSYSSVDEYAAVLFSRHPLAPRDLLQWVAAQTSRRSASDTIELKYDPQVLAVRDRAMGQASSAGMYQDTWQLLAALSCPVMVLKGAASSVLSTKVAIRIVKVLKHGTLCPIPLSGHSIHLDNSGAVTSAILHFLHPVNH